MHLISPDPTGVATARRTHVYRVHGLRVASSIELPELAHDDTSGDADVEIEIATVPDQLASPFASGPHWQAGADGFLFDIDGVARYFVSGGNSIRIMPDPACDEESAVRLYLMGTALGALLHQRGLFVLHASAIMAPTGAWLFTGPSGAGKSTLAAWMQQNHHWPLLSDDVTVIDTVATIPTALSGPNRLRLWRDALAALSLSEDGLARDLTRFDKFHMCTDAAPRQAVPFRGLILLESMDTSSPSTLEPLSGREALATLMGSVYRPELAGHWRPQGALFLEAAGLARRTRNFKFSRPKSFADYDRHLAPLLSLMRGG